jgi:hypothetical protein
MSSKILENLFSSKTFLSAEELIESGIFPDRSAIWRAVNEKKLPCICMCKRHPRFIRDDLVQWLSDFYSTQTPKRKKIEVVSV